MEITGKIKLINDTEKYDSGFRKREVVITTNGEYPEHIKVEFIQDKCDVLNNYKVGDEVNVGINLKGREWINPQKETVYFNTIQGWRIKEAGDNEAAQKKASIEAQTVSANDDLPF